MAKVWEKKGAGKLDPVIESYTVGSDWLLDGKLFRYEVEATVAHSKMLQAIGILTESERDSVVGECERLLEKYGGTIELTVADEDIHSKLENLLTEALGDVGKKVHTGRSRNDQVLVVMRLYEKERVASIATRTMNFIEALIELYDRDGSVILPGYTHTKQGMLTTAGAWAHAFVESVLDDLAILDSVYRLIDQNPLGTASGYGAPVALDRQMTTELLGFARTQESAIYAHNSRGKFEAVIVDSLWNIQNDLARMARDLIQYNMDELGFVTASDAVTTGSSIMPQKRNLDPCELVRARTSVLAGYSVQLKTLVAGLTSGYHRDLQETKEPVMRSFDIVESSLEAMTVVVRNVRFEAAAVKRALTPGIFATDIAFAETAKGAPFRDAYRIAAGSIETIVVNDAAIEASLDARVSPGSPKTLTRETLVQGLETVQAVWGGRI